MSDVTVKVSGQDAVLKNLDKIMSKQHANLVEAVQVTQAFIVNDAKSFVPVKTGFLQSTIHAGEVEVDHRNLVIDGEVIADANYASYVEFGTSRQKSQPYMIPAVLKNRANFQARVRAAMQV